MCQDAQYPFQMRPHARDGPHTLIGRCTRPVCPDPLTSVLMTESPNSSETNLLTSDLAS